MPQGTLATVLSIGGITLQKTITKTADHANTYGNASDDISLPAATEFLDFQNDEDGTATCTLSPGHGLSTGTYDLYWTAGIRYGVTVTITGDNADIPDTGAGDALPADDTTVNLSEQVQINTAIDGDAVTLFGMSSTLRSHVDFQDSGSSSIDEEELLADEPFTWHDTSGLTNPLTGNPITKALVSNGVTSGAAILTILSLEDSTP